MTRYQLGGNGVAVAEGFLSLLHHYIACIFFHSLIIICCNMSTVGTWKGTSFKGISLGCWDPFWWASEGLRKGVGPSSRASEGPSPSGGSSAGQGHAFWKGQPPHNDLPWLTSVMGQPTPRVFQNSWAADVGRRWRFLLYSWVSRRWLSRRRMSDIYLINRRKSDILFK